ncbi:MAG TPA: short chain dehydrogenase [Thermoanaerobaculia bacterium]|jgi:NAD(P)-dependent dehydrogenase (short-subunit alcohol dehydrogenase family)|nr:short chain dehydrogenase [Thermoanaerobaculia bacterium]
MRILVIGASGTIGKEIVNALSSSHEVISAGRTSGIRVDIRDLASIRAMYQEVGKLDAIISAAGSGAWKPLDQLTDEDFATSLGYKLMGQVNVIRYGFASVSDGGSITVTSGILSRMPMPGGAAISMVNSGLDGFVRGAALEAPRGIRVNSISPPWVSETLIAMGSDPAGGLPSATVAKAYVASVTGTQTGQTIEP